MTQDNATGSGFGKAVLSRRCQSAVVAFLAGLLWSCTSGATFSPLAANLRRQSEGNGLAVLHKRGTDLVIRPFDDGQKITPSLYNSYQLMVSPDGKTLAWLLHCGAASRHEIRLETSQRKNVGSLILPCQEYVRISAISNDGRRVSFTRAPIVNKVMSNPVLAYWDAGTVTPQTIREAQQAEMVTSWSPNGTELVYADHGEIGVTNTLLRSSHTLTQGSDPAWSPNGRWISYRASDGEVMLYDTQSRSTRPLHKGAGLRGAMHWSPDSEYLLLAQSAPWYQNIPVIGRRSECAVVRIADSSQVILDSYLNDHGGDCDQQQWIYAYRDVMEAYGQR